MLIRQEKEKLHSKALVKIDNLCYQLGSIKLMKTIQIAKFEGDIGLK